MSFIINPYSVQTPLLLDIYTDAAMAYSIRKLRTAYTGSAIRVRRSSDNTEQDIGFDANGNLDESALTTFVGAGSGFIRTWYDQTGNGRDAIQTTTANQPRIVNAGTIDKVNSKPAIYFFTGTTHYSLLPSNSTAVFQNKTYGEIYAVLRSSIASGTNKYVLLFSTNGTATSGRFGMADSQITADRFNSVGRATDAGGLVTAVHGTNHGTTNQYLVTTYASWATSGVLGIRQNAAGQVTTPLGGTGASPNTTSAAVRIGSQSATGGFWGGYTQELLVFNTDQSANRSDIEINIDNYFNIY